MPKNIKTIAFRSIWILSAVLYCYFGYYLVREEFLILFGAYSLLFLFFLWLIKQDYSLRTFGMMGISFRILLLLAVPILSQDFYRFIWDGRMLLNGYNPYLYLPENYLNPSYLIPNQAAELYKGMGALNGSHYSNYPPLNQLCFFIAALFSKHSILGSIVVFKIIIILADIGIFHFGTKLLAKLQLNSKLILVYFLNPFIIIELTGNLHFEGLMIFFLLYGLYLLHQQKWIYCAILIGCSIAVKLIPLLFLPLFFHQFSRKRLFVFFSIIGLTLALAFLPFFDQNFITNYTNTIGLWFGQFEFNSSLHTIAKVIDKAITGHNSIKPYISKVTPTLVITTVFLLAFIRKNRTITQLCAAMLFALAFYLATATTVHPWYLAMLLILSLFTPYRFPLVWTALIMLSYATYSNPFFKENYWLLAIQYSLVYGYFIWEVFIKKQARAPSLLKYKTSTWESPS